jgi:hypothetical protein
MAEDYSGWKTVDLSEYDDEVISKAFWLQEHIRRYGIDGIYFTRHARSVAIQDGSDTVADFIDRELNRL